MQLHLFKYDYGSITLDPSWFTIFSLRLTGHPSEQTPLTNNIDRYSPLCKSWQGQQMVKYCILIFPVSSKQSFLITVTFLTVISHLIFIDPHWCYQCDCVSINGISVLILFSYFSVPWFHSEHITSYKS